MTEFRVVDSSDQLDELVDELVRQPIYGLDTEFHRERSYYPKLALMQVSFDGQVALIDPLAVDVRPFARVLASDSTTVLHAPDQDLEVLDVACGRGPSRIFDTQLAAGLLGLASPSLSAVLKRFLGMELPKGDRLTDWLARPLSARQLDYAAADVAHLLALEDTLTARLTEKDRLGWLEAECDAVLARKRGPRDSADAWQRIKEARQLRGKRLAVAQAVAAWREERAAELDLPTRFVLPDIGVVTVAQKLPRNLEDLRSARGVDGRAMKGAVGEAILSAVRRGLEQDPPTRDRSTAKDLDGRLRPAVTLLSAWLGQLSRELELDPALLATRGDIEAILRGDDDARLGRGWRADVAGEDIRRIVSGDAALALDGVGGLTLEDRS